MNHRIKIYQQWRFYWSDLDGQANGTRDLIVMSSGTALAALEIQIDEKNITDMIGLLTTHRYELWREDNKENISVKNMMILYFITISLIWIKIDFANI